MKLVAKNACRSSRHIDGHCGRGFIIDQLKSGRGTVARPLGYGYIIRASLAVAAIKGVGVASIWEGSVTNVESF